MYNNRTLHIVCCITSDLYKESDALHAPKPKYTREEMISAALDLADV